MLWLRKALVDCNLNYDVWFEAVVSHHCPWQSTSCSFTPPLKLLSSTSPPPELLLLWNCTPRPPPPRMCLEVLEEAELARKTSLIFEALQRFLAHAQCAAPSSRGKHQCRTGVIPSIACVSVQSTYSWLWGQLTLSFLFWFFCHREIYL